MDFQLAKKNYVDAREKQKKEIIKVLLEEGYSILNMDGNKSSKPYLTGSGQSNYTSRGTIESYDLSNWKWISARNEEQALDFIISLQAFDIDAKTQNRHVLMDRIGLFIYNMKEYNATECFTHMINTGIDLPMTVEKYESLKRILNAAFAEKKSKRCM